MGPVKSAPHVPMSVELQMVFVIREITTINVIELKRTAQSRRGTMVVIAAIKMRTPFLTWVVQIHCDTLFARRALPHMTNNFASAWLHHPHEQKTALAGLVNLASAR